VKPIFTGACVCVCISWIEACIGEDIPAAEELEESLRNGVVLAKLAHFITPNIVPLHKVHDLDLSHYNVSIKLVTLFNLLFDKVLSRYRVRKPLLKG